MSLKTPNAYLLVLYALMHDVGKAVQRFAKRYVEGVEVRSEVASLVEQVVGKSIRDVARMGHEDISISIVNWLLGYALHRKAREVLADLLSRADPLAAAERGYEVAYRKCLDKLLKIDLLHAISRELQAPYNYHIAPLLSTLWIALLTGYQDHVGVNAYAKGISGKWSSDKAIERLYRLLEKLLRFIEECNVDGIKAENVELLRRLVGEEIWFPVKPLTSESLEELRGLKYEDAVRESSYGDVVEVLLNHLAVVKDVYGSTLASVPRSLVDTILAVLRTSLLLVPSSVFATIVPDISLYSHSKVVAAYAASEVLGGVKRYRLLVVDANGIQQFVSAPVKAAAASRILRGRSLLVELALDSLVHYTLQVFGGLPLANVVVSEGGTVEVIVPDRDVENAIDMVRRVADELSTRELGHGLGFTIAYSKSFDASQSFFLHSLRGKGGFVEVLDSLSQSLAFEKARRGVRGAGVLVDEASIEGFDSLTGEVVARNQKYKLRVDEASKEYVDAIAGADKLSIGDLVSEATHLSLVAGTLARNLVAIIGIHTYKVDGGVVEPCRECVGFLVDRLSELFCDGRGRLYGRFKVEQRDRGFGLIPFESSGSLYILLSLVDERLYDPANIEDLRSVWAYIYYVFERGLARVLEEVVGEGVKVYVEVKLVNTSTNFVPSREAAGLVYDSLKKLIQRLLEKGIDVVFNYMLASTYHPVKLGEEGVRLVDLDEYNLIALAKMDCDMVGEVKRLISISPSRLATLSDILNMAIAGKAYLYAVRLARKLGEEKKTLGAIPLYAGGDDVVLYGDWVHVIRLVFDVYKLIRAAVKPLTLSIAITVDRSKTPILELYSRAVTFLEDYAKRLKASCVIGDPTPRIVRVDGRELLVYVAPIEMPSKDYPWPNDVASLWGLEALAELLDYTGEKIEDFKEKKTELHILLNIAAEVQKLVEKRRGIQAPLNELLRLEIAYAYIWARRGEELEKLRRLLRVDDRELGKTIPAFPDETREKGSIREALRSLLAAKPVLDYLLLAVRLSSK